MMRPRLVLCSGAETAADDPLNEDRQVLALDALGPNAMLTSAWRMSLGCS